MQAYASAVTAQLRSEIVELESEKAEDCKLMVELRAEVTRLKAALRKAETELWRVPCQGLASWREAVDEIYELLGDLGAAKKGTP